MLLDGEPGIFSPVEGDWGHADEATLLSTLRMAWRNAAPPALTKRAA